MIAQLESKDFWSDVIISAAGDNELFEDVRISTVRSFFTDQVLALVGPNVTFPTINAITHDSVSRLLDMAPVTIHEQVRIDDSGIHVVLDVDEVNDDTVFAAMTAIYQALDKLDGKHGVVQLEKSRLMTADDVLNF